MRKPPPSLDAIHSFRGIFKLNPGEKFATQDLLEERAEDLRLEEAKWARFEKRMQRQGKPAQRSGGKR